MNSPKLYSAVITTEVESPVEVAALLRLRKSLFVDLCGWDLTVSNNLERDQFDTPLTQHCLLYRAGKLIGGFRAIRTDRDYLCHAVFPQLATLKPFPQRSDVWEISRFGVLPIANKLEAARVNYALMFRFAQLRGARSLVAMADLTYERFLTRLGIRTRRFGPPQEIGADIHGNSLIAVAGEIPLHDQDDRRLTPLLRFAEHLEIDDAAHVLGRTSVPA